MGGGNTTLEDLVTSGLVPSIFMAMLIVLGTTALWHVWKPVGFTGLASNAKWLVIVVPAVLIAFLLLRGLTEPSFSSSVLLLICVNTFFVGISEELMFRGLLFSGSYNRISYWKSIILVSLLFGGVHVLNGFVTGEFLPAAFQAVTAALSGLLFMAIRLGLGSIIPAIIVHWLWDFSIFINPASSYQVEVESMSILDIVATLAAVGPFLFGIIGLIALWRLKKHIEPQTG
jgi:hypothetical protein